MHYSLFIARYASNTGWQDIDIHSSYSLVNINVALISREKIIDENDVTIPEPRVWVTSQGTCGDDTWLG